MDNKGLLGRDGGRYDNIWELNKANKKYDQIETQNQLLREQNRLLGGTGKTENEELAEAIGYAIGDILASIPYLIHIIFAVSVLVFSIINFNVDNLLTGIPFILLLLPFIGVIRRIENNKIKQANEMREKEEQDKQQLDLFNYDNLKNDYENLKSKYDKLEHDYENLKKSTQVRIPENTEDKECVISYIDDSFNRHIALLAMRCFKDRRGGEFEFRTKDFNGNDLVNVHITPEGNYIFTEKDISEDIRLGKYDNYYNIKGEKTNYKGEKI